MKMETVEHFAKIALVARLIGHEQPLGEAEVEKLVAVRHRYNGGAKPASEARRIPVAGDGLQSQTESKETVGNRR
jgi:hypothetical protein